MHGVLVSRTSDKNKKSWSACVARGVSSSIHNAPHNCPRPFHFCFYYEPDTAAPAHATSLDVCAQHPVPCLFLTSCQMRIVNEPTAFAIASGLDKNGIE